MFTTVRGLIDEMKEIKPGDKESINKFILNASLVLSNTTTIPDEEWLLIPHDMRAGVLVGFIRLATET